MTTFRANLFELKRRLEIETGKPYSWQQMAAAMDVHHNTLYNLANDKTSGVTFDMLARLYDYFASQGLPLDAGDLLRVEED